MKHIPLYTFWALLILSLCHSSSLLAKSDAPNTQDHKEIGRYPDTYILNQKISEYDSSIIPLGPLNNKTKFLEKHMEIEGSIYSTVYGTDKDLSTLKVQRSYQKEIAKKGYKTLFECEANTCGNFILQYVYTSPSRKSHLKGMTFWQSYSMSKDWRMLVAKKQTADSLSYAMVIVAIPTRNKKPLIFVEVMDDEAFEAADIMSIGNLENTISDTGKAKLNGIFFETNSTELSEKSQESLDKIASYLHANPNKRFLIVGHTDSVGTLESNMTLSKGRAKAVQDALENTFKIKASQLSSLGVGPSSPAASNTEESGRQLNRRVELVLLSENASDQSSQASVKKAAWIGHYKADTSKLDPKDPRTAVFKVNLPEFDIKSDGLTFGPPNVGRIEANYKIDGTMMRVIDPKSKKERMILRFNEAFTEFQFDGSQFTFKK